jgi:hypothetical protein
MKISFFLLLIFCSCQSFNQNLKLDSFAFYEDAPEGYLSKAVTPDGVVLLISRKNNYPQKADGEFWKNALNKYLPEKGYKPIENGNSKQGKYFIFLVPGVKYDYFYFIHFQIFKEELILMESAGQYALLKIYLPTILNFCDQDILTKN